MSLLTILKAEYLERTAPGFRAALKPKESLFGLVYALASSLGLIAAALSDSLLSAAGLGMLSFILGLSAWGRLGLQARLYQAALKQSKTQRELDSLDRDLKVLTKSMPESFYLFELGENTSLMLSPLHSPLIPSDGEFELDPEASIQSLWKSSSLKSDEIEAMKAFLQKSIGDSILHWDFNSSCLPRELRLSLERGTRIVTLQWEAVRSDDGIVQKVLVLLKDVTELRLMYEDSLARNNDAKRLMELISNSPKKIGEFFSIAESVISEGNGTVESKIDGVTLNLRNIHTLKSMARGYQLVELSECFMQLETELLSQPLNNISSLQHRPAFLACEISLRNYKNLFQKVHTRHISGSQVSVDPQLVLDLTHQMEMAYVRSDIEAAFNALNEIRSIFACTLDKIVIDEINMLSKLADELGKPHPNLYVNELDIKLNESSKITLRKVFVHLFRNSIDHGIETEDERKAKGKLARGKISIHAAKSREFYRITYRDDGRGLSLPKILQRAIDLGMADAERKYSDQETAELIFQSGLSTTLTSNPISGRGVGMDAIKSFLKQEGGNISIELDPNSDEDSAHRFAFVIDIPLRREDQKHALLKRAS